MKTITMYSRLLIRYGYILPKHYTWKQNFCHSFFKCSSYSTKTQSWMDIEQKWQKKWHQENEKKMNEYNLKNENHEKEKFYCLSMFPYPSGKLHIGHVRVYTISDCLARIYRMKGYDVLHPIGWDAFGLPAENASIERGISPETWTKSNIFQAKQQLKSLGISFNWEKEISTCDKEYYKWTQWLFLKLYKSGLAYRKYAKVNWDPIDQTVLANEQVDSEGRSWRSGAKVEQRELDQWFLKISEYGEQLLDDLQHLNQWPEAVKKMQSSWIGRSHGSLVQFPMILKDFGSVDTLEVFTTRVDTLFGVQYLALCPEHPLTASILDFISETKEHQPIKDYVNQVLTMSKEQRMNGCTTNGIHTTLFASHPLTKEKIPIYFAEYVLPNYGSGCVMGVPGHDERDYKFAKKHDINIRYVIQSLCDTKKVEDFFIEKGKLKDSGKYTGLHSDVAMKKIMDELKMKNLGQLSTQLKLRDWLVSRQRFWGAPIPIIHCSICGQVEVPDDQLPVELPSSIQFNDLKGGKGGSPLSRLHEWYTCTCPKCGGQAKRDTDTLDTFVDSSWYFMRYPDANNHTKAFSSKSINRWLKDGVDLYVGGIEHAILHLLYSRFITKALYDQQLIPTQEPFKRLLAQGMVLGKTYKSGDNMKYLKPNEIEMINGQMIEKGTKTIPIMVWEKMSKSKYNGVDPEDLLSKYGADVIRLAVLFKAPPSNELEWDEADLAGQSRWINRIWKLIEQYQKRDLTKPSSSDNDLKHKINDSIDKVSDALLKNYVFNVAIAELMKLSNELGKYDMEMISKHAEDYGYGIETLIKMLAPFAPHNAAEMFEVFHASSHVFESVHESPWPIVEKMPLSFVPVKVVVQVKGKTRGTFHVPHDDTIDGKQLEELALDLPTVKKFLGNLPVKKVIIKKSTKQGMHHLINFVV